MNFQEGNPALFHRVIIEDGAPTARTVPKYDDDFVNHQFHEFLQLVGCADVPSSNVFQCLRAAPSETLVAMSVKLFDSYVPSLRYPFQPVVDDDVIRTRPTLEWESGKWNKVPIMTGFSTDEGSIFVPRNMKTSKSFTDFFSTLIPAFDASDLEELNALYPDPLTNPDSPYVEKRLVPIGNQFKRTVAAYGHSSYICNIYTTGEYASRGQDEPVWEWHWATNVSFMAGAAHTGHTAYQSYEMPIRWVSVTQDLLAQYVTAYWTSFIVTGDPNTFRTGLGKDRPHWGTVDSGEGGRVMVFGRGNDERPSGRNVGTIAQMETNDEFQKECEFWNARSDKLDH